MFFFWLILSRVIDKMILDYYAKQKISEPELLRIDVAGNIPLAFCVQDKNKSVWLKNCPKAYVKSLLN